MGWRGILGSEYGIVQAPLGPDISGPELVAAVANAGGLGFLRAPDWVLVTATCFSYRFSSCASLPLVIMSLSHLWVSYQSFRFSSLHSTILTGMS